MWDLETIKRMNKAGQPPHTTVKGSCAKGKGKKKGGCGK